MKIQPVRFLESQMAALRMSFKTWLDREPEEPEDDEATEEYEEALQKHADLVSH